MTRFCCPRDGLLPAPSNVARWLRAGLLPSAPPPALSAADHYAARVRLESTPGVGTGGPSRREVLPTWPAPEFVGPLCCNRTCVRTGEAGAGRPADVGVGGVVAGSERVGVDRGPGVGGGPELRTAGQGRACG